MISKVSMERVSGKFHLEAKNESGNTIEMDGSPKIGGENKGVRPMELMLMALGGCSSIDVIMILNKQKLDPTSFKVEIDGEREEGVEPSLYRNIKVRFIFTGDLPADKLYRAVELSMTKYCSVAKTMEPTAKITSEIELNGKMI
jgi:putative redox protein